MKASVGQEEVPMIMIIWFTNQKLSDMFPLFTYMITSITGDLVWLYIRENLHNTKLANTNVFFFYIKVQRWVFWKLSCVHSFQRPVHLPGRHFTWYHLVPCNSVSKLLPDPTAGWRKCKENRAKDWITHWTHSRYSIFAGRLKITHEIKQRNALSPWLPSFPPHLPSSFTP